MTERPNHSYLDFCVHPKVRTMVMAAEPAILFDKNLSKVCWVNAAGAKLFGGAEISDLLQIELPEEQSFVRQLRAAVSQLEPGKPLNRGFRVYRENRPALLSCDIQEISKDEAVFYFLVAEKVDGESKKESQLAREAAEGLSSFAEVAAIVDDHGLPIGATANFAERGLESDQLSTLVAELRGEADRLIKRPLRNVADEQRIAGLARISDQPGRTLIVLAAAPQVDPQNKSDRTNQFAPEETFEDMASGSPEDELRPHSDTSSLVTSATQQEIDAGSKDDIDDTSEPAERSLNSGFEDDPIDTELPHGQNAVVVDDPLETLELAEFKGNDEASIDDEDPGFSFDPDSEPVRFAWTTDDSGFFRSVSPELAETVGPNAADIEDRSWQNVATVFGFDNNGEIGRLLERRDTWSGKTVMWPIQGTDLVVPIDLAALPVFGPSRSFEGFRGFGIIRTADTMLDPEETGLVLGSTKKPEQAVAQESTPDEAAVGDHPNDETPLVVDLFQKTDQRSTTKRLSESETKAFIEIRDRLADYDEHSETLVSNDDAAPFADVEQFDAGKEQNQISQPDPLHRSLLDKLPVCVLIYRTGELLYANRALLEYSGHESLSDLNECGGLDELLTVTETDGEENGVYLLVHKDGSQSEIEPVLHTVPWRTGKALLLSFFPQQETINRIPPAIEITEISEIQNILDTASDGIIVMENDGRIVSLNASAEALFGLNHEGVAGQMISELFAIESRETIADYIASFDASGVEALFNDGREAIGRESSGGLIPLFVTISRLDTSGRLCAVVRDMTSWKNAEEELVNARRSAELANEQKSDFLTQISHEIRTPLNAIIGFSDVMIEEQFGPIDNDRYREYLRDIKRSGIHVLDLVNDLLDLSKIEAGKMELAFEAVELNQVVAETVALLQPQANGNRIIIRTSLSRAVPKVVADPRSIRQIILNLVSNAIKFTPSNGQVIVSTVYESDGEVALRIRDTGTGMNQKEIEEAMKPFQQVHRISERTHKGTGLGLPLTKALVEANRAKFHLESEPEHGTIAHVRFPTQRVLAD